MIIITILIGFLGLGILVFLHELGHFLACKAVGIDVEAFSLGWGKPLLRKKWKGTEYRISVFPVGGYCKMKGEEIFKNAIEQKAGHFEESKGSMFSASPLKLIIVYLCGPLANLVTAILFLTVVLIAGYTNTTESNRITLVSHYNPGEIHPADAAGMKTGDIITEINGREIRHWDDLSEIISRSPEKPLEIKAIRDNQELTFRVVPDLDKTSGRGIIGIHSWTDPVVESVEPDSPALDAGLQPGDILLSADGDPVEQVLDLAYHMSSLGTGYTNIEYRRSGQVYNTQLKVFIDTDGRLVTGIQFPEVEYTVQETNIFRALAAGTADTFDTLNFAISSIGLFFKGVSLKDNVGSPIKISYIIGDATQTEFSKGFGHGLSFFVHLLALISIALCFTNLLPIPGLDGGMILFNTVSFISRKPPKPKLFYRYNMIGFLFIIIILVLTVINDIAFLSGK